MPQLQEIVRNGARIERHRPWPRISVDREAWLGAAREVAAGRATLLSMWADGTTVHLAVISEHNEVCVFSLECGGGSFPSVAGIHPPAIRLERAIADLSGLVAEGAPDLRPWLDHGRWDTRHPLGNMKSGEPPEPYVFLPSEGEGLHQIPVGPVHAGIIEPGHFRFTVNGETVVRLEERLGYVHKGIDVLMRGSAIDRAARLAGRVSGDSTVAYAWAFARAAEAALEIEAPPRALYLRALMAELERIANHFGDIGAICNDASFSLIHT
ncbi:MAG TPA: NADH-quinone oxidoreductase subunit C, partial [Alphaproteobacteria bacterium]|nr:NADH-quinone oxidoreductase subunit C [Alphaproteobacteria bacterium]